MLVRISGLLMSLVAEVTEGDGPDEDRLVVRGEAVEVMVIGLLFVR